MPAAYRISDGTAIADAGSTTVESPSMTIQSGDTVYICAACSDGTPAAPTSVAWDPTGVNETFTSIHDSGSWSPSGPYARTTVWRRQSLTAKTGVFRVTWAANKGERLIEVWVGTGIDTTTPNGTVVGTTGTTTSVNSGNATTTTGQLVLGFGHILDISGTATLLALNTPNGTERDEIFTGTAAPYDVVAVQDISASGTTQAMTWTAGGTTANYEGFHAIAIPINDVSAGDTLWAQACL